MYSILPPPYFFTLVIASKMIFVNRQIKTLDNFKTKIYNVYEVV